MAKYVLGTKRQVTFEEFDYVRKHIEDYVSKEECDSLITDAVKLVKGLINYYPKAGYAWSAGKDSLALQVVMEKAGVESCVFCTSKEDSPKMLEWVKTHQPKGMMFHVSKTLTKKFIKEHADRIFPKKEGYWWYKFVPWEGQQEFIKFQSLDICFYGRRTQDGNQCKRSGIPYYKKANERCITCNPIADWKHEDVLAVIHYYLADQLPPIYDIPVPYIPQTGYWYEYAGWNEVAHVFPELMPVLVEHFPEAKQFINK